MSMCLIYHQSFRAPINILMRHRRLPICSSHNWMIPPSPYTVSRRVRGGVDSLSANHVIKFPPLTLLPQRQIFTRKAGMLAGEVHLQQQQDDTSHAEQFFVLQKKLETAGILVNPCKPGQYRNIMCPKCRGGQYAEKSFSLYIRRGGDLAMWTCFRAKCGWSGAVRASTNYKECYYTDDNEAVKSNRAISEEGLDLEPLCAELIKYFCERNISAETLRRNGVMQRRINKEIVIAFTYRREGKLIGCKYRTADKEFIQERNTEKILYGVDDIKQASDIIIVEGEIDKLSMEEAGFCNCVSVPDGAPAKVSNKELPILGEDKRYRYLWNCREYLSQASRIILATDADGPGQALAEELARRLGRERCWRVKWPQKNVSESYKDANEVLMYLGTSALKDIIENAELYPIRGLFRFGDYFDEINTYYHGSQDYEFGVSTGWKGLETLYRVVPGELTVVTGIPGSGKSEWIDALLVNINEKERWKFALCSMENKVQEHARKLLEKHIKKPFFSAGYSGTVERMNMDEFEQGKEWLNNHFYLIRCEDDCLPSIKWVLTLAKSAVLRHGIRGLVIDPYNELDHQRPSSQTETEYVSQMLTQIKRFAQHCLCHVWFVAHPRQLHHWLAAPPTLYDISGSAHFANKCDNGIVIHRNRDAQAGRIDEVQIYVRKVRNKVIGNIGTAVLSYNRITGEFMDVDVGSIANAK